LSPLFSRGDVLNNENCNSLKTNYSISSRIQCAPPRAGRSFSDTICRKVLPSSYAFKSAVTAAAKSTVIIPQHQQRWKNTTSFTHSRHHNHGFSTSSTSTSKYNVRNECIHNNIPINIEHKDRTATILGVWIFHRHGDRTPCIPLLGSNDNSNTNDNSDNNNGSHHRNETCFWETKIPKMSTSATNLLTKLEQRYPVDLHETHDSLQYYDESRKPFGFLTELGMGQMMEAGKACRKRYSIDTTTNEKKNDSNSSKLNSNNNNLLLFRDNIRVYSTNYLRTVTSARCFMDGLLLHHQDDTNDESAIGPTITVRDKTSDPLNAFDRNPDKMHRLVTNVISRPRFQKRDLKALPLATRLSHFLPGLVVNDNEAHGNKSINPSCSIKASTAKQKDNKSSSIAGARSKGTRYKGCPSKINWIHAADHFVCRTAHNISLLSTTFHSKEKEQQHQQQKQQQEQELQDLAKPTMRHLCWRFGEWFCSPPLLAEIGAPPLVLIEETMQELIHKNQQPYNGVPLQLQLPPPPLEIHSCHDVTLLSLLYAMKASIMNDDDCFWPVYASTLTFELVHFKSEHEYRPQANDSEHNHNNDGNYFLRLLLNGAPVEMMVEPRQKQTTDCIVATGKNKAQEENQTAATTTLLTLKEFSNLVTALEQMQEPETATNVDSDSTNISSLKKHQCQQQKNSDNLLEEENTTIIMPKQQNQEANNTAGVVSVVVAL